MTGAWARTPLRVKLVVALVLLAAVGLAVSGLAATTALRGYLVDRVDQQLQSAVHDEGAINGLLNGYGRRGDGPRPDAFGTVDIAFLPSGGGVLARVPTGSDVALPRLPSTGHKALTPFTVAATSGSTSWRTIETPASLNGADGTLYVSVPLD
ncbi:MAG: tcrY, partial [Frankiales bacterium]|nr:tcrY [Frankiales bacterium]